MNEKVLKALLAESAVKKVKVIASGGHFMSKLRRWRKQPWFLIAQGR